MESIIVEIYIPAITFTFDFRLPSTGRVYDVVNEIVRILETTQLNLMFDKTQPMLCDMEHGCNLDPQMYIAETGLHDGSRLLLV